VEHQFRGGERLGKPRPAVSKRKVRKIRAAAAKVVAIHGPPAPFTGDAEDYLRAVMSGALPPDPMRMSAANALLAIDGRRREHKQEIGADLAHDVVMRALGWRPGNESLPQKMLPAPAPKPSDAEIRAEYAQIVATKPADDAPQAEWDRYLRRLDEFERKYT
jgi:hypothetical protein